MINHPTVKFLQEKQPFNNPRVSNQRKYLTSLEKKVKELREEKELALAEAKHMQHQTIEAKDNEVAELRTIIANLNNEMKELKQKNEEQLSKMELELKSAVEKTASLEKERIKLQEGNKKMTEEMKHKIDEVANDNEVMKLRTIIANLNNEMKERKQKDEKQLSKMELELKSAVEKTASSEEERKNVQKKFDMLVAAWNNLEQL